MDAKSWARVKSEEPWIMHFKDTWYPHSLKIRSCRAGREAHVLGSQMRPLDEAKVWIYTYNSGVEKIRHVAGGHGMLIVQAILNSVSPGDLIRRIAVHWLGKENNPAEAIDIIKSSAPRYGALTGESSLNEYLYKLSLRLEKP